MQRANDETVDVRFACPAVDAPTAEELGRWAKAALTHADFDAPFELGVRVVSEDEIRALNARYRGRDAPTNVLSFPAGPLEGLPDGAPAVLGDVVLCADVIRAEAAERNVSPSAHWAHMIVHGVLHLLGYDHDADADAARMEAAEASILAAGGIANPYRA